MPIDLRRLLIYECLMDVCHRVGPPMPINLHRLLFYGGLI